MGHFTHPLTPEGLGENMYWPGQIHPPPSCFFCYEWATSTTFHHMWTNGEAQINQLSASLDVYGFFVIEPR